MAKFDLQEYIKNNRQQAILFGALGGVVIVGLLAFLLFGRGPEAPDETLVVDQPGTGTPFAPGGAPGAAGMPGGMPGPPMPGGAPAASGMPGGMPGPPTGPPMPGTTNVAPPDAGATDPNAPAEATATVAAPKKTGQPPMYAPRQDPFRPLGYPNITRDQLEARLRSAYARAKEEAELARNRAILDAMPIPQIARGPQPKPVSADGTTSGQTPETPVNRRVAGLLYGDRVLAVLETEGKSEVVKPGDIISDPTGKQLRVARIDREAVLLKRLDNNQTIRVPLEGMPEGSAAAGGYPTGGYQGPGGLPGPGMMPGPMVGPRPGGMPMPVPES